jgi:3-oxoacyl-(acyl-carrier-protein) synthase
VDYVSANANSSPHLDRKESTILNRVFGDYLRSLPVSSIKAIIGHPFGASGAFQTAATCLAIERSLVPPTHNIVIQDPACELDVVPNVARRASIRHAVVSSHGFGGLNAYLALRAPSLTPS